MSYSLLEAVSPRAASLDDLFTVPAGYTAHVASIAICNVSGTPRVVRLAFVKGGGTINAAHYVLYDAPLPVGYTLEWGLAQPLTLAASDTIRIYADTANVAFSVFGELEQSGVSLVAG